MEPWRWSSLETETTQRQRVRCGRVGVRTSCGWVDTTSGLHIHRHSRHQRFQFFTSSTTLIREALLLTSNFCHFFSSAQLLHYYMKIRTDSTRATQLLHIIPFTSKSISRCRNMDNSLEDNENKRRIWQEQNLHSNILCCTCNSVHSQWQSPNLLTRDLWRNKNGVKLDFFDLVFTATRRLLDDKLDFWVFSWIWDLKLKQREGE